MVPLGLRICQSFSTLNITLIPFMGLFLSYIFDPGCIEADYPNGVDRRENPTLPSHALIFFFFRFIDRLVPIK